MGVFFLCPNCNKPVDPISPNATMGAATKRWQHKDCSTEPAKREQAVSWPQVERRRTPRRSWS